jgi:hypothetical protein
MEETFLIKINASTEFSKFIIETSTDEELKSIMNTNIKAENYEFCALIKKHLKK